MPREYYTNMLALRADIVLMHKILKVKDAVLSKHFDKLNVDISLIVVENFLTIYTNTLHHDLTEVIMDHFMMHGSVVLLKASCLILKYMRSDLLKMSSFGSEMSNV